MNPPTSNAVTSEFLSQSQQREPMHEANPTTHSTASCVIRLRHLPVEPLVRVVTITMSLIKQHNLKLKEILTRSWTTLDQLLLTLVCPSRRKASVLAV